MVKRNYWHAVRKVSPVQIIALGFLIVIFLGTALLSLPIAFEGDRISTLDTMFTATSATCVTGLITTDTATHWSFFGEVVILILIQIGGLGFMTILTLLSFMTRRKITLKERMILSESLSGAELGGIVKLIRRVLLGTVFFELLGASLLAFVFIPDFGVGKGIWKSIFISVSAFCNAGFDVMGDTYGAFSGLEPYVHNVTVNLTVCFLIIMGGIGFLVWGRPRQKYMPLHTKIVLLVTGLLLAGGTVLFYVFEYNNPATIGSFSFGEKVLASFFQSVTTRTAGFNTIPNAELSIPSKLISMLLMFIGGSPGSTAGGIKTVTFAIVLWGAFSSIRGQGDVAIFRRRIPKQIVFRAMSVFISALLIVFVSAIILLCFGGGPAIDLIFEVFSALGTVGLGTGITPGLPSVSKILIMILMYIGRVGIITLSVAVLLKDEKINNVRYPEEKILLG
ncbi:MAG: Trk family potassium uptake protein [Clostridia bacterium]|nr:Trk family potassium uptake protein [Clostridia bacterium]